MRLNKKRPAYWRSEDPSPHQARMGMDSGPQQQHEAYESKSNKMDRDNTSNQGRDNLPVATRRRSQSTSGWISTQLHPILFWRTSSAAAAAAEAAPHAHSTSPKTRQARPHKKGKRGYKQRGFIISTESRIRTREWSSAEATTKYLGRETRSQLSR